MNTKAVKVRDLFKFTPIEIKDGLKTNLNVLFEDNKYIHMSYKEIILLRFIIDVYTSIPYIPITSKHSFTNFYTNGILTSKTINKSFEVILEDVVELHCKPNNDRKMLEPLFEKMYNVINDIYNDLVYDSIDYANSINIIDLLDIQLDNKLISAMKDTYKNKDVKSVNKSYEILDDILRNNKELKNNIIARGYISGTMNPNQIKQILSCRGFVTEVNSTIFKYPIASSFTLGLSDIYDLAIESRSGVKALVLSNTAVQESEYLARQFQLIDMIIERLVDDDCGQTDYVDWYVTPNGNGHKSDLPNLIGKYYYNPETKQEEVIKITDKYLEGKIIKLRTAYNCKLANDKCICTKCLGDLSYTIPLHSNLGHFCSVMVSMILTQSLLSTKHLTSSATSNEIKLCEIGQQFFKTVKNEYFFKKEIINKDKYSYRIILTQDNAIGLKDLNKNTNVFKLSPTRISRIESIVINIIDNKTGKSELYPIVIKDSGKFGYFTLVFLDYVVKNSYQLDDLDRYVINIDNWDFKQPIISMPELEYNFLELTKNLKAKYTKVASKGNKCLETPESKTQELFYLLNSKLDINVAMLEVMVYAITIRDLEKRDYRLGRNSENRQLSNSNLIIDSRSLGAGYAWEHVKSMILSPISFLGNNNIEHPMDVAIKPDDVIREYYKDKIS